MYTRSGFVDSENSDESIIAGDWRNIVHHNVNGSCLQDIHPVRDSRYRNEAIEMRNNIMEYFLLRKRRIGLAMALCSKSSRD